MEPQTAASEGTREGGLRGTPPLSLQRMLQVLLALLVLLVPMLLLVTEASLKRRQMRSVKCRRSRGTLAGIG